MYVFLCVLGFKAPDKIDPRMLDPRFVFSDVDNAKKNDGMFIVTCMLTC